MVIIKRDGTKEEFDADKIFNAWFNGEIAEMAENA